MKNLLLLKFISISGDYQAPIGSYTLPVLVELLISCSGS